MLERQRQLGKTNLHRGLIKLSKDGNKLLLLFYSTLNIFYLLVLRWSYIYPKIRCLACNVCFSENGKIVILKHRRIPFLKNFTEFAALNKLTISE